jgi:hypothetical protein
MSEALLGGKMPHSPFLSLPEERPEMQFSLIPADTEDTASSRIRVYSLQRALVSLGHVAVLGPSPHAEFHFIQKRVTVEILQAARQAKAEGRVILYDVDDLGPALWYFVTERCFFEMIRLADAVTTDTAGHKDQLIREYGAKRVEVVPDTIDYYPSSPVRLALREGKPLRVLWFGSSGNIALFEKYASALTGLPDVEVVVATTAADVPRYSAKYPHVSFVPWSRGSFISTLQSCDVSFLMHDGTPIDSEKSNNKMIASVTWGVPAVVSRTREYERTAREAGVEEALFSDEAELRAAIEGLRPPEARFAYLDRAQPEIWRAYSPNAVAQKFVATASRYSTSSTRKPFWSRVAKAGISTAPRKRNLVGGACRAVDKVTRWVAFGCWRLRFSANRTQVVRSLYWEVSKTLRHAILQHVPRLRRPYLEISPRGSIVMRPTSILRHRPGPEPDYVRDWIRPEGLAYRMRAYERQRKGGTQPLTSNPTVDELRSALNVHQPKSVLEVGCGWGRLLEELSRDFDIQGCDVSMDMLKLCSPQLNVFHIDLAVENQPFLRENAARWDVLFTRGVMLYLREDIQMAYAMNNMLMLASKKILIWEWPEVCERMKTFSNSSQFEYHPIEHSSE